MPKKFTWKLPDPVAGIAGRKRLIAGFDGLGSRQQREDSQSKEHEFFHFISLYARDICVTSYRTQSQGLQEGNG